METYQEWQQRLHEQRLDGMVSETDEEAKVRRMEAHVRWEAVRGAIAMFRGAGNRS